jgi:hypothetical protein
MQKIQNTNLVTSNSANLHLYSVTGHYRMPGHGASAYLKKPDETAVWNPDSEDQPDSEGG